MFTSMDSGIGVRKASLLVLILLTIFQAESVNPGAKIRLSQSGLNYGAQVAVDILNDKITKFKIPDLKNNVDFAGGKVEYEVKNIKITGIKKPSSSVTVVPVKGLTWTLANLNVDLSGEWHYIFRMGFIKISDGGTFEASVTDVAGTSSALLSENPNTGGLTIQSTDCVIIIPNLKITVHGGASWLYNLFIDQIEEPIRNSLQTLLCAEARKAIDENAGRELSTMPVTVKIGRDWLLDYRLVALPQYTPSYMQSFHKAEFFQINDKTEAPFQPDALPDSVPFDRMVTLWLSDYILNTAGNAMYNHGIFKHTLTARDLPQEYRGYLDTICSTTTFCFGGLVPEIRKRFPNASVEMEATATEPVKALITSQAVEGRSVGSVIHRARLSDGSLSYLFTANVSVIISILPRLDATSIKGKVIKLTPEIKVTNSSVGVVSGAALTAMFKIISAQYIVPQLNVIGERGFSLPMIKHVQFMNVNLTTMDHCLCVTGDLKYVN